MLLILTPHTQPNQHLHPWNPKPWCIRDVFAPVLFILPFHMNTNCISSWLLDLMSLCHAVCWRFSELFGNFKRQTSRIIMFGYKSAWLLDRLTDRHTKWEESTRARRRMNVLPGNARALLKGTRDPWFWTRLEGSPGKMNNYFYPYNYYPAPTLSLLHIRAKKMTYVMGSDINWRKLSTWQNKTLRFHCQLADRPA